MKTYYKIFTGTAKEVEDNLNQFAENKNTMIFCGMSTTNEQTTVLISYYE